MTVSEPNSDEMLLHAYSDGALEPVDIAEFERRMAADVALRRRYDSLMTLRRAIRELPQEPMPPGLQDRVMSSIGAKPDGRRWSWRMLAAAAVIGAVFAGSVMAMFGRYQAREQVADMVVASHIRSLLAPQPFDIASSDRHTVKPWFTTRLPESPQVIDLNTEGFVLAGGRVDVIGREPVATVVYRRAAHVVSLTTLPRDRTVPDAVIAGYNVRSWRDADFTYVAVSDLPGADLENFERAFSAAQLR